MDSTTSGQRKLIPRGAMPTGLVRQKMLAVPHADGKVVSANYQQCDSGFGDDEELRSRSIERNNEVTNLRSVEERTENLSIEDPDTDNRHPSLESQDSSLLKNEELYLNYAHTNDVRYLLAQDHVRKQLYLQDDDGDTALHLSIINMKPMETDAIISVAPCRECLDIYNDLKQAPLHLATITRQPAAIRRLLEAGASPNIPDRNGRTALHLACDQGDIDCVKEIVRPLHDKRWGDEMKEKVYNMLHERDYEGYAALHKAVFVSSVQIATYLVSLGANVNIQDAKSGRSPLHHAVEAGNLSMINCLLYQCSADPDAMTFGEVTPLHIAAGRGMEAVVALLLAAGSDPSLTNYEGESPLNIAASKQIHDMVKSTF